MVPRGETIIVASSFEQARIAFEHVSPLSWGRGFTRDKDRWRVWDTAQQARIECKAHRRSRPRHGFSDPRRAHGLAPVLILCDEPAQWDPNKAERMVAALRTAAGKQTILQVRCPRDAARFVKIIGFQPDARGRGGLFAMPCGGR